MMMYDFWCTNCDEEFEDLVANSKVVSTSCPTCGELATKIMSPVKTGLYSIQDTAGRAAILKKRSQADTLKQVKKEPERWGMTGIRKAKEE